MLIHFKGFPLYTLICTFYFYEINDPKKNKISKNIEIFRTEVLSIYPLKPQLKQSPLLLSVNLVLS